MDCLLQGIPNVVAYIDDVLLTGETEGDHLQMLDKVLSTLETAGLKLKRSKCIFMAKEVEYLGHRICNQGIHPTSDKIKAIRATPQPTNVTELNSFLGLLSYYSNFCPTCLKC